MARKSQTRADMRSYDRLPPTSSKKRPTITVHRIMKRDKEKKKEKKLPFVDAVYDVMFGLENKPKTTLRTALSIISALVRPLYSICL